MKIFKRTAPAVLIIIVLIAVTGAFRNDTPEYGGHIAAIFRRADDGEILYSENAGERIAPASLAKLLTAAVALKYIAPEEVFTVGTELELVPPGSSICLISKDQRLTLYDLITGMLMVSGNDAAYTVAVSSARIILGEPLTDTEAVRSFCGLMNDFAKEQGMNGSHFTTPDGSDDDGQYTTARDLMLLSEYALSVPEIREIMSTRQKYVVFESGENITWINSNRLLDPESGFYSEAALGMKTGTTPKAGCCLIAAFSKENKTYISVVAGCRSDRERYEVTLKNYSLYA